MLPFRFSCGNRLSSVLAHTALHRLEPPRSPRPRELTPTQSQTYGQGSWRALEGQLSGQPESSVGVLEGVDWWLLVGLSILGHSPALEVSPGLCLLWQSPDPLPPGLSSQAEPASLTSGDCSARGRSSSQEGRLVSPRARGMGKQ